MGIDSTAELEVIENTIKCPKNKLLNQQEDSKFRINEILNLENILDENNKQKTTKTAITIDLSGVEIESFINSMIGYQQETFKETNITLKNNGVKIGSFTLKQNFKKENVLRDIKRLKIGSIKSFPKKPKEKLNNNELEVDREKYFEYINKQINNKYNNIFSKQNFSLTDDKLFYKEIYENEDCAEFCITMIHFLEFMVKNIHKTNKNINENEIFDEILNTVSINSGLYLNGEIIKKSFELIKKFWSYSNNFKDKLTFN